MTKYLIRCAHTMACAGSDAMACSAKLARELRAVVDKERELQTANEAHLAGAVGKAVAKKSAEQEAKEELERAELLYKAAGLSAALGGVPIFSTRSPKKQK